MDVTPIIDTLSTQARGLLVLLANRTSPIRPPRTGKAQVLAEAELQQRGLLVFRKDRSTSRISIHLTNDGLKAALILAPTPSAR